jgi:hypothetical protein
MRQLLLGVAAFAAIAAATPASAQVYYQYPYYQYPYQSGGGYYVYGAYPRAQARVRVNPRYRTYNQSPNYDRPAYDTDPDPRVRDYLHYDPPDNYN